MLGCNHVFTEIRGVVKYKLLVASVLFEIEKLTIDQRYCFNNCNILVRCSSYACLRVPNKQTSLYNVFEIKMYDVSNLINNHRLTNFVIQPMLGSIRKWDKRWTMLVLTNYSMSFCSGLLNVLDSDQFDSESDFLSKYGDLKNAEQVACGEQMYCL